jgi:hypothetical protein
MRIAVSAVFAVALSVMPVLAGELPWIKPADNPLLGGWQLVEETDLMHVGGHCATGMMFEATRQTAYRGTMSGVGEARYFTNKGLIVVPGVNTAVEGGILSYRFADHDHMERRDYLLCKYQRGNPAQKFEPPPPGCPSPEELEAMKHPPTPMTYDQAMVIIRCEK